LKRLLSNLPKVDEFLIDVRLEKYKETIPYNTLLKSIREGLDFFRKNILNKTITNFEMDN